jgi:hypothetical protein
MIILSNKYLYLARITRVIKIIRVVSSVASVREFLRKNEKKKSRQKVATGTLEELLDRISSTLPPSFIYNESCIVSASFC